MLKGDVRGVNKTLSAILIVLVLVVVVFAVGGVVQEKLGIDNKMTGFITSGGVPKLPPGAKYCAKDITKGGDSGCDIGEVCVRASAQIEKDVELELNPNNCPTIKRGGTSDHGSPNELGINIDGNISEREVKLRVTMPGTRMCVSAGSAWCGARVGNVDGEGKPLHSYTGVNPKIKCAEKRCENMGGSVVGGKVNPVVAGPIEDGVIGLPVHVVAGACMVLPGLITLTLDCAEDIFEKVGLNHPEYITKGVCCKIPLG